MTTETMKVSRRGADVRKFIDAPKSFGSKIAAGCEGIRFHSKAKPVLASVHRYSAAAWGFSGSSIPRSTKSIMPFMMSLSWKSLGV